MKKYILSAISLLAFTATNAQTQYDAADFATGDLNGTARYVGMGGALDALGGDVSVMSSNPAGTAIYKKTDMAITGSVLFSGQKGQLGHDQSRASFDQAGIVFTMPQGSNNGKGLQYINFGVNYQKKKNNFSNANVNIGIRQICEKVLNMKHEDAYSGYTFRHTWATVAQNECGATLNDVDFGLNHAGKTRLARTYVKVDFTPAWELNEKVIEKIFFTEDKTSANKNDEPENNFFRFSAKQLIKGTLYFKGKILASVEDIGFNNIEEVIAHLMKDLPDTIPPRSMVLIRIENKDKGQKQDYTRMVH